MAGSHPRQRVLRLSGSEVEGSKGFVGLRFVSFSSEQEEKSEALLNEITLNILNTLNYFNKPQ